MIHFGFKSDASFVNTHSLRNAKKGFICPAFKTVRTGKGFDSTAFFAKLSDYGRKENCILFESADIVKKYGEHSIGSSAPCLKVSGRNEKFEILALNETGERFLRHLKGKLGFCDSVKYAKTRISGSLTPQSLGVSEEERLRLKTHADILRTVAFALKPTETRLNFPAFAGLFGSISYDFIGQFEVLPKNKSDPLKDPDYELFFLDNLFHFDHAKKALTLIASALLFEGTKRELESEMARCLEKISEMEAALALPVPKKHAFKKPAAKPQNVFTDCGKNDFVKIVEKCKENILEGDVFQIVPSRTNIVPYYAEPLDIYSELKKLNPSPYMFFINAKSGILLGSSPETFLRVQNNGKPNEKTVEIRPIAGTRQRGKTDAGDAALEKELLSDEKELAEHTMLIDLARNDVARVSIPGTRHVERPYHVEKYSHVQHIVSNILGTLRPEFDCLHAYLASMNMGTLTGAPKVKAMELLRCYEKTKRGFYGGSVAYITPSGELDSAIVIRSARLKNGKAFVRAGAGIVFDSVPEKEFEETERKARACLKAIESANKKSKAAGK